MKAAFDRPWAWTPAQVVSLAFGIWWVGNGIAVFLAAGPGVVTLGATGTVEVFGISIAVNGWHGLLHLVTGLAGVAACSSARASRLYSLLVGTTYLVAAACGLFLGPTVFGLVRVDDLGSVEHAIEGVILLVVWLTSPGEPGPAALRRAE